MQPSRTCSLPLTLSSPNSNGDGAGFTRSLAFPDEPNVTLKGYRQRDGPDVQRLTFDV
jgi:hypothetical protein